MFQIGPREIGADLALFILVKQHNHMQVNHHYRSITRPAKATDVGIKRRIFNDCTSNGDFEFSVEPTNLFWRDKRRAQCGRPVVEVAFHPDNRRSSSFLPHVREEWWRNDDERLRTSAQEATIGDKIVETLYVKRVTSENKRTRTPPLSTPFKVGVFVVFYR